MRAKTTSLYSIIDIETTGGNPPYHRITEIAVIVHDGIKVVNEFNTLINPERSIPWNITRLTGITNEMVQNAPRFCDIAKQLIELTEGNIFVAHNVTFDYNFVRSEFAQLGYDFKRNNLCTVRTSRALIPGKQSYSLGNLCNSLGINVKDRHRAAGDALATARLFEMLYGINKNYIESRTAPSRFAFNGLHPNLDKKKLDELPEETGVYYLHDEKGKIIYIGKSNSIRPRVMTHLDGKNSKKSALMKRQIADVTFTQTGSELVALLLESEEIKKHQPFYNRALRRSRFNYGICVGKNDGGYLTLKSEAIDASDKDPIVTFATLKEAKAAMQHLLENYHLCQKLTGLYETDGPCFYHTVHQCNGACIGKELPDIYNKRVQKAIKYFSHETNHNLAIVESGRRHGEKAIVCLEEGRYKGFGYIDEQTSIAVWDEVVDCIKPFNDNRDTQQIIRQYLMKNKVKLIEFKNLLTISHPE